MYFRQFNASVTRNRRHLFIRWDSKDELDDGGESNESGSWDYYINRNKTNFKLELIYE